MFRYITNRIYMMIPVLLGVSIVIFTLMYFAPGDPIRLMLGLAATAEQVNEAREAMGLNDPFLVQYLNYMKQLILHGNMGISYITKIPITQLIMDRLPVTLVLSVLATLFALIIGMPAGIISAVKQYSLVDNIAMVIALIGISMPNFWSGLLLIIVFAVKFGWFPVSGWSYPFSWVLPMVSVGAISAALIARMTRSSMLEVIRQDYITTARAKGQKEIVVIIRHGLKNSLIPIITSLGLVFGQLIGGAVVAETVFAIPGLGKLMVDSILNRDFPVVQGGALTIAFMLCFVNLLVDISYAFIDPRIKGMYHKSRRAVGAKAGKGAGEVQHGA